MTAQRVSPPSSVVPAGHHPPPRADGTLPTVVTWLEMTARPPAGARPKFRADTSLGRVTKPTVPFYRFLYDAVGLPWLWYERRLINDATLAARLQSKTHELYLLSIGGEPAGFFQLDFARAGEAQLELFGLRPEFIGQGLGRWFLGEAAAHAWRPGVARVLVDTNTLDHPRALALYQRGGFTPFRREEKILQDPRVLWPELYGKA